MAFGSVLRGGEGQADDGIPRPFLHPRAATTTTGTRLMPWWKSWSKKYVILCCVCGGTAILLGVVFIAIYFTLHYYTTSLQYFETIPTYAPAVVLIITGLLVMCFARRRNRYAHLIKLCGGCCLMCALLCVVITVTTTVIHMNRLQTLRECVYTHKSKTCTCFAGIGDDESAARYVFNNTPDCEVVHGSLYTCLRAMFGLSVVGILVCIFSSMLVYQLLGHEKKKLYWEQLEMRRRFFYCRPSHPVYCNCYDDYGFAAPPHDLYHWQPWEVSSDRCWPSSRMTPRLGFGSPSDGGSQRSILVGSSGHRASGWNWLSWNRGTVPTAPPLQPAPLPAPQSAERPDCVFPSAHGCWTMDVGRSAPRRNNGRRRRRSNDAVFHHLNMTPPFVTETSYAPSVGYAVYGGHHLWGPPPPYSRQTSSENVGSSGPRVRIAAGTIEVASPEGERTSPAPGKPPDGGGSSDSISKQLLEPKLSASFTLPLQHCRRSPTDVPCSKSTSHIPVQAGGLRRVTADTWPGGLGALTDSVHSIFTETALSSSDCSSMSTADSYDAIDYRTSMIVSTTPSSPAEHMYRADLTLVRSLPNICMAEPTAMCEAADEVTALSESSPVLLAVPSPFVRDVDTPAESKSKSLGSLFTKNGIIVTFKSVNV